MTKTSRNLLNGSKELKQEFAKVSDLLPKNWIDIYLDNYCSNLRGSVLKNKYLKLRNFCTGKSTPEPSEMKIIMKIIESEKSKQLQAS